MGSLDRLATALVLSISPVFLVITAFPQPPVQIVLGNPSGAITHESNPNNYLVIHNGFILSYNRSRGTPNWVTWHLSGSDIGNVDRTNAFAADPAISTDWQIDKDGYSPMGSVYDRGHMCPSEDRSNTVESNRESFLMTNMQPQVGRLNRGTWRSLESYVQSLAKQGWEAYLFAGCYGNKGTINNKVTIPTRCWKIVVLLPEGANDKQRMNCSTRVIAVDMPNDNSVISGWRNYRTTIDTIEFSAGYNFLSTLPLAKQRCLESKLDDQ